MSNKPNEKLLLIPILSEREEFLKEMMTEQKVERGLIFESSIGKNLLNKMEFMKSKGYFYCGMIVEEDQIEMLFQRHPKQKDEQKLDETNNKSNQI